MNGSSFHLPQLNTIVCNLSPSPRRHCHVNFFVSKQHKRTCVLWVSFIRLSFISRILLHKTNILKTREEKNREKRFFICSKNPFTHKNICLISSIIRNPEIPITLSPQSSLTLGVGTSESKTKHQAIFYFQLEPLMCIICWSEGFLGQRQAGRQSGSSVHGALWCLRTSLYFGLPGGSISN